MVIGEGDDTDGMEVSMLSEMFEKYIQHLQCFILCLLWSQFTVGYQCKHDKHNRQGTFIPGVARMISTCMITNNYLPAFFFPFPFFAFAASLAALAASLAVFAAISSAAFKAAF